MAILHMTEIRKMKKDDLDKKYSDLKKELMRVRTQVSQGANPDKPGMVKEIKRTIARINTYRKERGEEK